MVGFGVDMNAPEFPFVIPTLLLRPFKFLWKPIVDLLAWILNVLFEYLLGDTALHQRPWVKSARVVVNDNLAWIPHTRTVLALAAESIVDAVDEMDSDWHNGY